MSTREIIEKKLSSLKQSLITLATSDGEVSPEERMILNSITYSIDNLLDSLDAAFEDGIIDDQEKAELNMLLKRIKENAETTAEWDEYISSDEVSILNRLKQALVDLNKDIKKL